MAASVSGYKNRFLTPDIIAHEALFRLQHNLCIAKLANHAFGGEFEGSKIGDTITIKKPFKAKATKGRTMVKSAMLDESVTLSLDDRWHFALDAYDDERTLDLVDFGDRYLAPGAEEIAYQYEISGGKALTDISMHTGSPGSAMSTKKAQIARAQATEMAIPMNERNYLLMHPFDLAEVSDDVKEVNLPPMVQGVIRQRYMGMLADWKTFSSVHIPPMEIPAVAAALAPLANNATAQEGATINTDGWTASTALPLNVGNLITFAGVYEVQPRGDRENTGRLKTFRVTSVPAAASATGGADIGIDPPLEDGTSKVKAGDGTTNITKSAFQNATAKIADNAAISIIGASTTAKRYRRAVFWEKTALAYVNVKLAVPSSAAIKGSAFDPQTNMTLTFVRDFDIKDMFETSRIDGFWGTKLVYPEIGIQALTQEV